MNNKNIFIDITLDQLKNLNVLFGGRGIGKTYSILKHVIEYTSSNPGRKFIWLRDSERVIQKVGSGQCLTAPIESNEKNFPHVEFIKDNGNYKFMTIDNNGVPSTCFGYLMALSTFHNARGIDFSDVDYIIWDEFIPEEGSIIRKYQGSTFLNMYESVNRNREMFGAAPVKIILLSNTNEIYSEVLEDLGVSGIIENMKIEGINKYIDNDIWIEFLSSSAFYEAKKNTFLYRISNNEKFKNMALENNFNISTTLINHNPHMKGSKALLVVDDKYTLVQLKNGNLIWIKRVYKNVINYDMDNEQEAILFRLLFNDKLRKIYITGSMFFDSIYTQRNILNYAKM